VPLGPRLALRLKPFERLARLGGALLDLARGALASRLAPTVRGARIILKLPLEGGQSLGDRGFHLEQFVARLERRLVALARIFVPSTAILASVTSPSPISAVTLCVNSRSRTSTCSTRKSATLCASRSSSRAEPIPSTVA